MSPKHVFVSLACLAGGIAGGLACAPSAEAPTLAYASATTDGDVALRNLDAGIATLGRAYAAQPTESRLTGLVGAYLRRARFTGSVTDLAAADDLTHTAIRAPHASAAVWLARARVLGTLHRFEDSNEAIAAASALGGENSEVEAQRITNALAEHGATDALTQRAAALVSRAPTFAHRNLLAAVLAKAGEFEEADRLYERAAEGYRDVSPFPIAYSLFARGVMWAESAHRPERARPLYEEAVRRLPGYVRAQVHLAELEAAGDELDAAIDRLEPFVTASDDPEPEAVLGELLLDRDPERAAAHAAAARERYRVLLGQYPLAFAHHANEYLH